MAGETRFVGLDCHQESVQVCVLDAQGQKLVNRSVDDRWQEIVAVVRGTADDPEQTLQIRAAIGSCSGAARLAEELLEQAQWVVTLAHPGSSIACDRTPTRAI